MKQIAYAFVCLFWLSQLTGCFMLKSLLKESPRAKKARLKQKFETLKANKDAEGLAALCKSYSQACHEHKHLQIERFLASSGCSNIEKRFTTLSKARYGKSKPMMSLRLEGGEKLAKCGKWDYLFNTQMFSSYTSKKLLAKLDASSLPVTQKIHFWLKKQGTSFFPKESWSSKRTALRNLTTFLKTKNQLHRHCPQLVQFLNTSRHPKDRRTFLVSFIDAKCKSAAPAVLKALTDEYYITRMRACYVMRHVGSTRDIRKLRIVAYTDSSYKVRIACRSTIGFLKLRN